MHKRSFRLFPTLLFAFSVCALILVGAVSNVSSSHAQGIAPQRASGAVTSGRLTQDTATVLAYWTPARMQLAHSADALLTHAKFTQPAPQHGASGVGAPALPKAQHSVIQLAATKIPHSSYPLFPYSTVGKVFFTDPSSGLNYVCSGSAVNSTNLSVVDTAGHCVVNGGSSNDWYTNWVFCPQYFKGKTPDGCWVARQLWSWTDWVNAGSLEDDFGDAVVSPNSAGNLVSVVGGTGWAYGQATSQSFSAFGYPAAAPFNGNLMYVCGPTPTKIVSGYDDGTVIAIGCNMTGGSSGGPWLISINGNFGYVNGHNDFKYTNDLKHMYSPYYDSDWYGVFNSAQTS